MKELFYENQIMMPIYNLRVFCKRHGKISQIVSFSSKESMRLQGIYKKYLDISEGKLIVR